MSIDFRQYVTIFSGVGGAATTARRYFGLRIFSPNPLISPDAMLEFPDDATGVGTFFGTDSEEYKRALFYFSFRTPGGTSKPKKIQFARLTTGSVAPIIFSDTTAKSLTALNAITAGSLSFNIGGESSPVVISGIDFSAAASLAAVATALQTVLNASADLMLKTATVAYQTTTRRFVITGGTAGAGTMTLNVIGGAGDVGAAMGLYTASGAIWTVGADATSPANSVALSANQNNDFGSFVFMSITDLPSIVEAAQWNVSQNVMYQFHVNVSKANASAWAAALVGFGGTGLTHESPVSGEYPEVMPCAELAAIDFSKRNSMMNFMFRSMPGLTPSVVDTQYAIQLNSLRVNYYGRTQTAGQIKEFYQRGKLMGGATDPIDMNVYGGEQWLKDDASATWFTMLETQPIVPATDTGRAMALTTLAPVITRALFNGTIQPGKNLTADQKIFITEQTGDDQAWYQVQSKGYWYDATITQEVADDGSTEYVITYLLIYSKADAIRKVEGTHTLI